MVLPKETSLRNLCTSFKRGTHRYLYTDDTGRDEVDSRAKQLTLTLFVLQDFPCMFLWKMLNRTQQSRQRCVPGVRQLFKVIWHATKVNKPIPL